MSRPPFFWRLRNRLGDQGRRKMRSMVDLTAGWALGSVRSSSSRTQVALTFDDGPEPSVTPLLLDCLDLLETKCTFFLLVVQAKVHPDLVKQIVARGHEIGLHGNDHRRLTTLPHSDAVRYLRSARADLEHIAGERVRYYRPPYGAQSLSSYLATRRAGLEIVVWSADAADWEDRPVERVVEAGMKRLDGGGILLLHERLEPDPGRGAPTTTFDRVEMTRQFITEARSAGWQPVTVGQLLLESSEIRSVWFRP